MTAEVISRRVTWPVSARHFDLVALGGGLTGQPVRDVLVDQLGVAGRHQVAEAATDQRLALHAHQARELPVGVQDGVAVNQHRLVDAIAEFGEQPRRAAIALRTGRRRASADD